MEAGVPVVPRGMYLGDGPWSSCGNRLQEVGYPAYAQGSWVEWWTQGCRFPSTTKTSLKKKVFRKGGAEAEAAFGNGEGISGKDDPQGAPWSNLQILGDSTSKSTILLNGICSSRRNQKGCRTRARPLPHRRAARRRFAIGPKNLVIVNYECCCVRFEVLMDMDDGKFYFIEVNPRVSG